MTLLTAVLDTNLFLHYSPIDQIRWHDFIEADHIVLIITPTVLRQLSDKEDSPGSRKLRERAATAIKKLTALSEQPAPLILRDGVEVQFASHEPQLDFASYRLSPQIGDDWLLASVLELRGESESTEVVLVTQDLGLKIKARTHQIKSVSLPEVHKLPDDLDEDQKRIKELEAQIRELRVQTPVLSLVFDNEADHAKYILQRSPMISPDALALESAQIHAKFPKLDPATRTLREDLLTAPSPAAIHKYNEKLEHFHAQFDKYLQEREEFSQTKARQIQFGIRLLNTGSLRSGLCKNRLRG